MDWTEAEMHAPIEVWGDANVQCQYSVGFRGITGYIRGDLMSWRRWGTLRFSCNS